MKSELPPLSKLERFASSGIGCVAIFAGVWLYNHPATRITEEVEMAGESTRVTETKANQDPGAIVVTLVTIGAAFLLYGANGVKLLKFSSPMGELESGPLEATVPKNAELLSAPVAPNVQHPQALAAEGTGKATFELLVMPFLPMERRPAVPLRAPIPVSGRAPAPGDQVTVDTAGLRNAGSIYFFSHDLMLCMEALLTNAHKNFVVHTAGCALAHLARIGFGNTPFFQQMTLIQSECANLAEDQFTAERRSELAAEVFRLSRTVGDLVDVLGKRI